MLEWGMGNLRYFTQDLSVYAVDNWDDKSKIITLKTDKGLFQLLQAQELKFLKLFSGISFLL